MRLRNKYRKPTTLRCNAGRRCSLSVAVGSLVACFIMLQFYAQIQNKASQGGEVRIHASRHPLFRELEEVEEENIKIPPPRRRSPRAEKRKPKKPKTSLIDEFLDESSQLRPMFFPDRRTAIDPLKDNGNDSSFYYYPGKIWLDTDGNPIQAHGGGILYDERSSTYYWYGEYKDGPTYHAHKHAVARVDLIGVGCYSSKDLWTWRNEGIVLSAEEDVNHDLHKLNVLERPKVIYNEKTSKYVMWMHIDDTNYTKASVGIAISHSPSGPFNYLRSFRPHGFESRDMTIFKDDDDVAYLIYSSEDNTELHVGPLTQDYLDVTPVVTRVFVGERREAPALFKHDGTYYMITSGCTSWTPNEALAHAAESIMGPWETIGNPCIGGNKVFRLTTFFSQSTFVLPLPGFPGSFIFIADRWNPADLKDSRYIWLPLLVGGAVDRPLEYNFGFPLWSRVSIYWHKKWRLPYKWDGEKFIR